ncbi:unnamed protein product [Gordionus sp. m RMFG-2023]
MQRSTNITKNSNLSSLCFANITVNKFVEKKIVWLEKVMYVYILGPFLILGILGNILYFIIYSKTKNGQNILQHENKTEIGGNVNTNLRDFDKSNNTVSKISSKIQTNIGKNVALLKPSNKIMNDSTAHFYVIIYTILLWDVIACVTMFFFPFLYYSSSDFGISNKQFMILITKVTYFLHEVCVTNLNWNTAILSMNRFVAIYFPYRFANLITRTRPNRQGGSNQKFSIKNNAYLNYVRRYFGDRCVLKKTRKSAMLLMTLIFLFSMLISLPCLFYVNLRSGIRVINSNNNTVVELYERQISCDTKLPKIPIKFSYNYIMTNFFISFSIPYDKYFSVLVYLIPTLLITFSQIFVFVKMKKLERSINFRSHVESNISTTNFESCLTISDQNNNPSRSAIKDGINNSNCILSKDSISPPTLATPPIRSRLQAQNLKRTRSSKSHVDKYILALAIAVKFLLLNLPYVIFVFVTNGSWVEGASITMTKVHAVVYFLKFSNHSINVYVNIIFNSTIRSYLVFQLNKYYKRYITNIRSTSNLPNE